MVQGSGGKKSNMSCRAERRTCRFQYHIRLPFILLAVFVYCYLNIRNIRWYEWPYKFSDDFVNLPCARPEKFRQALADTAADLDKVMTKLNVVYFLAYGSLFGVLRYGAPVPWDSDVDIGVIQETMSPYSLKRLQEEFGKLNFTVSYHSYGGLYKFKRGEATIDAMLFTDYYDAGQMYRVGYEAWLFFLNYRWHHNFPARLVRTPLPRRQFSDKKLPVPRGGIELQKYHYRSDWEEERPPPSCRGVDLDRFRKFKEQPVDDVDETG